MSARVNVAIVGSNGFIARHLVSQLSKRAELDLFLFGRGAQSLNNAVLPYRQIDLENKAQLAGSFKGVDVAYYLVSETIPATSWENPRLEIDRNLLPFLNFLETAAQLGVKKVAFISSAGTVYGSTSGRVTEDSEKKPFSPYGITKLAMESFLHYYSVKFGLKYDVYRVSNVYGEGQDTSKGLGIINTFLEKIIKDRQVTVYGDGSNTRNYIYVKDVAALMAHSVNAMAASGIYNVSSSDTLSINELIALLKNAVSEKFEVHYTPGRGSDNTYIDLDNRRILTQFNDFKFTTIEAGIGQTYNFIKTLPSNK